MASDNGGEFVNAQTSEIFRKRGIKHRRSPPYHHHESNGIAERYMRTIVTDARAMIGQDHYIHLWPEAISYCVYLRNRKPHQSLPNQITPYERLHSRRPHIGHIQPFLRPCYLHIPVEARKPGTKLLDRAEKTYFVGFGADGKSVHRLYVPGRRVITTATDKHGAKARRNPSNGLYRGWNQRSRRMSHGL